MPVNWGLLRDTAGALDIAIRSAGGEPTSQIRLGRQVNSDFQLIVASTPSKIRSGIGLTSDNCVCITATEPTTKRYSSGIVTDTNGVVWATATPVTPLKSIYDPLLEFVLIDQKGALVVDAMPPTAADILALTPVAWYRYGVGIDTSGWADQSGNGNDIAFTGAPTVDANGVTFNGTDEFGRAVFTLNQPCTAYALWMPVTAAANARVMAGAIDGTVFSFARWTAAANNITMAAATAAASIPTAAGAWLVEACVVNGASSVHQQNNTTATGDPGSNNAGGITLAANESTVASLFSNSAFKEVIIFPVAHDAATRATVINYLSFVASI